MNIKQKMIEKSLTIGSWLSFGYFETAEMMAKSGFEWIVIDMEHSSINYSQMARLIQIINLCNITTLVRIGFNDPMQIKRAMDAGANGIIVPMVMNSDDAKKAIEALYYFPKGIRGAGLYRAQKYGEDFDGYRMSSLEDTILIVQIEHKDAVKNLDSILDLKLVDGFIVGPYDLSSSLGVPGDFDNSKMKMIIKELRDIANSSKKPGGFHIVKSDIELLRKRIDEGFRFFAYGTEMIFLMEKIRDEFEKIQNIKNSL